EHLAAASTGACRQFAWQLQDARGASAAVVVTVAPFEDENLLISLQPAQSKAVSPSPDESLLASLPVAALPPTPEASSPTPTLRGESCWARRRGKARTGICWTL